MKIHAVVNHDTTVLTITDATVSDIGSLLVGWSLDARVKVSICRVGKGLAVDELLHSIRECTSSEQVSDVAAAVHGGSNNQT